MDTRRYGLIVVAFTTTLLLAGCIDLTAPNENSGSIEQLQQSPSRQDVQVATQGLLAGTRELWSIRYVQIAGHLGREGIRLGPASQEFVIALLEGALDPGRFYISSTWDPPYKNIRLANTVLEAVNVTEEFDETEKQAIRGFVKTIQAHDFLMIVGVYDDSGAPIQVAGVPGDELPAIESKEDVYGHIAGLLDEARDHLNAAGSEFPFTVTPGFSSFDTPGSFLEFNRALKARVDVYMENWSSALNSLSGSFLDTAQPLSFGAYHSFSNDPGDATNPLFDPNRERMHAHPSLPGLAQDRANGEPDLRFQRKVREGELRTISGIDVTLGFTIYDSPTAPIPIIKNEELILLRAEANIGLEQFQSAEADLNFIRQTSGGLPAIDDLDQRSQEELIDELLYNKLFSLLWEGGHHWIDMRRYGRLEQLPMVKSDHVVWPRFPLPADECIPRGDQPAGCALPTPLTGSFSG